MITRRQFAVRAGIGLLGAAVSVRHPKADENWSAEMEHEIVRIESRLGGRLGVAIFDTATGRQMSYRGEEHFPMASTFKVLACGAVLKRVDEGKDDLSRRIRFGTEQLVTYSPITKDRVGGDGMSLADLCEAAMTRSDNTAANLILKTLGEPPGVTAFARSLGDPTTRLDRWEPELNEAAPGDSRDTTTPEAMARDLRSLVLGSTLSEQSRAQLTNWLVSNKTGDTRLRTGFPKDWRIGDKTGGGENGTASDVAVVWPPQRAPLVISVYLTETEVSADKRNAAIAEVGRVAKGIMMR